MMEKKKSITMIVLCSAIMLTMAVFCEKKKEDKPDTSADYCKQNPNDDQCKLLTNCQNNPDAPGCNPPPYCTTHPDAPSCKPPPPFQCVETVLVGTSPTNWRFQCLTGMQVEDLKNSNVCCINQDLRDLDASSDQYGSHKNFSDSRFDKSFIGGANFTYGILKHVSFLDAKISTPTNPGKYVTSFQNAVLSNSDFSNAELGTAEGNSIAPGNEKLSVNFTEADLSDANFKNSTFGNVTFLHSTLENTNFEGLKVDTTRSDFSGVLFIGSVLRNNTFGDKSLSLAAKNNFSLIITTDDQSPNAILENLTMKYSQLDYVNFSGTGAHPLKVKGSIIFDTGDSTQPIKLNNATFFLLEGDGPANIIFKNPVEIQNTNLCPTDQKFTNVQVIFEHGCTKPTGTGRCDCH